LMLTPAQRIFKTFYLLVQLKRLTGTVLSGIEKGNKLQKKGAVIKSSQPLFGS